MKSSRKEQTEVFYDCIIKSLDKSEFRWDYFFNNWFRVHGTPYFFLFKKNLSVTNAQFVELFSLITQNSTVIYSNDKESNLLYHPTSHIRQTFENTVNSLLENYDGSNNEIIRSFCSRYLDIYTNTVAVDLFYGSCAIFLPPSLDMDINTVVFKSGYIHSAGIPVYVRNIGKSRKPDFISSIESHLKNRSEKIPFVIYSHEDFTDYDQDSKDLIDKGISQNKMYADKMSMGRHRLNTVISELTKTPSLSEKIYTANPGSFRKNHNFNTQSTIWLISDKAISSGNIRNPGLTRYYICYEQIIKNQSPFFIFDENKPGWKSHTTLPHSLTASLLNISNSEGDGDVCDPFGGTGTTWLETKRLDISSRVKSTDLSPVTNLLHSDNLKFFLSTHEELSEIQAHIENLKPSLALLDTDSTDPPIQLQLGIEGSDDLIKHPLHKANQLLIQLKEEQPSEDYEYNFSSELVESLEKLTFTERIFFLHFIKN